MKQFFAIVALVLFSALSFAQNFDCPELLIPQYDPEKRLYGYADIMKQWVIPPAYVKAYYFNGNIAMVQKGNKFGAIDCKGYMAIPPIYDDILPFRNGYSWVLRGKLWGLIDFTGKSLAAPSFTKIIETSNASDNDWAQEKEKWGLFAKNKMKFEIKPAYDMVSVLTDTLSVARWQNYFELINHATGKVIYKNLGGFKPGKYGVFFVQDSLKKWGAVNASGHLILNFSQDSVYTEAYRIIAKHDSVYGIFSLDGKPLTLANYTALRSFKNGLTVVKLNGKWGAISTWGNVFIPIEYNYVEDLSYRRSIVRKDSLFGLFDPIGQRFVIPLKYKCIHRHPTWKNVAVLDIDPKSKQMHFIVHDTAGKRSLDDAFENFVFSDSAHWVRAKAGNKWGILDINNRVWLNVPKYDSIGIKTLGYAPVMLDSMWGVIDEKGQQIIPCMYQSLAVFPDTEKPTFLVEKRDKFGAANLRGDLIVPALYDSIIYAGGGFFKVSVGEKYGIVDPKAQEVTEMGYNFISNKLNSNAPEWPAIAKQKSKFGLIEKNGKMVVKPTYGSMNYIGEGWYKVSKGKTGSYAIFKPNKTTEPEFIYDDLIEYSDGFAPAKSGGQWGFINQYGQLAISAKFESVLGFRKGIAYAKSNGKWGAIDKKGKWIIEPKYREYIIYPDGSRKLID